MSEAQQSFARKPVRSLSRPIAQGLLQRKCACGQHTGGGLCTERSKKRQETGSPSGEATQRRAVTLPADARITQEVPAIVHDVLRSPGQSLDATARAFFEPRFGHDFSGVCVHTDARAAESARAVNALAYTAGQNIVFAANQYVPRSRSGQPLLAHELAHAIQQSPRQAVAAADKLEVAASNSFLEHSADRAADDLSAGRTLTELFGNGVAQIARQDAATGADDAKDAGAGPFDASLPDGVSTPPVAAPAAPVPAAPPPCLTGAKCTAPVAGSAWDFSNAVGAQQAVTQQQINTNPAVAKKAGAARPATNLTAFVKAQSPGLLSSVAGIVVNPAIGDNAGAQATDCHLLKPPAADPNASCIEVPDSLEKEAHTFLTSKGSPKSGKSRSEWETWALQVLTHEVQHVKFAAAKPAGITMTDQIPLFELDEMAALFVEYPVRYHSVQIDSAAKDKDAAVRKWIVDYAIGNGQEDIRGMLTKMRCTAPCDAVNASVRAVFNAQTASWTPPQKSTFVSVVNDPANGLVGPDGTVPFK